MARYFFDFIDGGQPAPDQEGWELADIEQVRLEALRTLGNIAKDELAKDGRDAFQVAVRDEAGEVVLTASLLVERRA